MLDQRAYIGMLAVQEDAEKEEFLKSLIPMLQTLMICFSIFAWMIRWVYEKIRVMILDYQSKLEYDMALINAPHSRKKHKYLITFKTKSKFNPKLRRKFNGNSTNLSNFSFALIGTEGIMETVTLSDQDLAELIFSAHKIHYIVHCPGDLGLVKSMYVKLTQGQRLISLHMDCIEVTQVIGMRNWQFKCTPFHDSMGTDKTDYLLQPEEKQTFRLFWLNFESALLEYHMWLCLFRRQQHAGRLCLFGRFIIVELFICSSLFVSSILFHYYEAQQKLSLAESWGAVFAVVLCSACSNIMELLLRSCQSLVSMEVYGRDEPCYTQFGSAGRILQDVRRTHEYIFKFIRRYGTGLQGKCVLPFWMYYILCIIAVGLTIFFIHGALHSALLIPWQLSREYCSVYMTSLVLNFCLYETAKCIILASINAFMKQKLILL